MTHNRLRFRDPRTVARDIPGILDILFPRLTGGLVAWLNRRAYKFRELEPVSNDLVDQSQLQKAMLFELATARSEGILAGQLEPKWQDCIKIATERQSRYYDAKVPGEVADIDFEVAEHAAQNLVAMLFSVRGQHYDSKLEVRPLIPGMGWIASGTGDFALGRTLIEVKHTERNFGSGDFRQVLMYWILQYAWAIEHDTDVWSQCLLLNPRRNSAISVNFDTLLQAASVNSSRVEVCELLRSIVGHDLERR